MLTEFEHVDTDRSYLYWKTNHPLI